MDSQPNDYNRLQQKQKKYHVLAVVYNLTLDGWLKRKSMVPWRVHRYWDQRDELSIDHGILLKRHCIVIPDSQWEKTLTNLHVGHQGTIAMQQIAKITVYWPEINADIEDFVNHCQGCLVTKPNNTSEPLLSHEVLDRPWEKIGADFFEFEGKKHLLIIDYFSKDIFIEEMRRTTAESTINIFRNIFSTESAPKILITDNGPPFNSSEFKCFSQQSNFQHITSSPNHPQSDGQAERAVQTVKQCMARCKQDGTDWKQALLELQATPIDKDLPSPVHIPCDRPVRTINGQAPAETLNM